MKILKISKGGNHQKPKVHPQKQKPKPLLYAVRIMVLAFFGKQDPITWLLLPFHLSAIQSILIPRICKKKKTNQIKKSHKQFWNLTHKKTEREKGREMWWKQKEEKKKRRKEEKGLRKKMGKKDLSAQIWSIRVVHDFLQSHHCPLTRSLSPSTDFFFIYQYKRERKRERKRKP